MILMTLMYAALLPACVGSHTLHEGPEPEHAASPDVMPTPSEDPAGPSPGALRAVAEDALRAEPMAPAENSGNSTRGFRMSNFSAASWILPTSWPSRDGRVQLFVYEVQPLPTGRVLYEVRGPLQRAELAADGTEATVEVFEDVQRLGRTGDGHRLFSEQQAAEKALLDVVVGRQSVEAARAELRGYCVLFRDEDLLGRDLRARIEAFVTWLDCPPAPR
jgi:hypothetical protein